MHFFARSSVVPGLTVLVLVAVATWTDAGAADSSGAPPALLHFDEVVQAHPVDPARGAAITEVLRGERASVNVWQVTNGIPPHLHRRHEEVLFVRSGTAIARIGDQTITMKAGDLILIPRGVVHSARATAQEGEPFRGISVFAPAFDGKDRVAVDERTPRMRRLD